MISVVIPAYNAEETIERALDSVLQQSHRDLEVIVVDDGSDDGTAEIVEFHARRDSRVRLLQIAHMGPGAARNAGIDAAIGEWLAFLDADDEYTPEAFKSILGRIAGRDVGLAIFSIKSIRAYIYAWPPPLTRLESSYFPGDGERAVAFIAEYFKTKRMLVYSQSNKLYRRNIIDTHGLRFPEQVHFGEDRLFNYAYLRHAGSVITMSERLLKYHHGRPGALSGGPSRNEIQELLALSEAKLSLFRNYGYSESDLEELRIHEARQILDEAVRALIRRERTGGRARAREGAREMLAARLDRHYFSKGAAVSRRVRVVQLALQTRSSGVVAGVVQLLRRSEDRRILRTRRQEIGRTGELQRLKLTAAGRREQARYYFLSDYEYFLDRLNEERSRNVLRDKAILLRRLDNSPARDFLRREWVDLRRASFSEFASLVEDSDRIVAKLFNGARNRGTDVIDVSSVGVGVAALYELLIERKQYVVESYLPQHPGLSRFYEAAVATLRIHTLNLGGEVQLVLPTVLKFGSGGGATSNVLPIQAFVDRSSGSITSDGIFKSAGFGTPGIFERHPDSGVPFRGAVVPFAADAGHLVSDAARLVPEVRFIGWDIACTPGGPVIIEGNAAPLVNISWQVMLRTFHGQRGMRADYEAILEQFTHFEKRRRRGSAWRSTRARVRIV